QLEYEIAKELGIPIYVFICGDNFPYDPHEPEDEEKSQLQQAHRERLLQDDHLYSEVSSKDELTHKVQQLQTRVEQLSEELKKSRGWLWKGLAAALVVLALLGMGLIWNQIRLEKVNQRLALLDEEMAERRGMVQAVADHFSRQRNTQTELQLTDTVRFQRALQEVAQMEGIPSKQLASAVDQFVAAVRSSPEADFLDRALADFASRAFEQSAENASKAVLQARREREAADQVVAAAGEALAN
ncbi:MAG: hypothetical protein GTO62_11635, partial [Planctomycetales bacterium]|nr:hypothetical protein [Planctomycetales bacterium]NIP69915.1 hypothetical protein [Planctomycetales bacterium]